MGSDTHSNDTSRFVSNVDVDREVHAQPRLPWDLNVNTAIYTDHPEQQQHCTHILQHVLPEPDEALAIDVDLCVRGERRPILVDALP